MGFVRNIELYGIRWKYRTLWDSQEIYNFMGFVGNIELYGIRKKYGTLWDLQEI